MNVEWLRGTQKGCLGRGLIVREEMTGLEVLLVKAMRLQPVGREGGVGGKKRSDPSIVYKRLEKSVWWLVGRFVKAKTDIATLARFLVALIMR